MKLEKIMPPISIIVKNSPSRIGKKHNFTAKPLNKGLRDYLATI